MALHLHSQSSLLGSHQSKLTVLKERSGNLHPPCSISHLPPPRHVPWRSLSSALMGRPVQCLANTQTSELTVSRRSGNYHPDIWGFDFVQSLKSDYVGEECVKRVEKLIMDVKQMFDEEMGPLARLELINDIQRLGVGYHFENEIKRALYTIANSNNSLETEDDLHFVALGFWLLRQHGYEIAQDVFNRFKDEARNFKAELCDDVKGMLSLYEASHLALEGENILDEARAFTSKHLKDIRGTIDPNLDEQVSHSLELPLHWRMKRLEARWYINVYSRKVDVNPVLLELAMLDFNMVQATHQDDLKAASRWWKNVGLGSKLSFARDRLVENFLWTVGIIFEPQFGCCRTGVAKVNQLITTIDDIYDVYGTLDELELFTDVVERWDINAMERLPDYMKICFLALYNTINEMAYDTLIERGVEILPYLKKMWVDLCKAYLAEAKWYYKKYMPTLEEYLEVARMSIAGHVILGHAYFLLKQEITKEALECFDSYPSIIRWSSMILRLGDDLGTSTVELEKGDTAKSIQCYMHENDVSEEVAREHIINMIHDVWKKINEDQVDSRFPKPFIGAAVDLARMTLCIYQYGDGFGASDRETKDRIQSLLVDPVFIMKI